MRIIRSHIKNEPIHVSIGEVSQIGTNVGIAAPYDISINKDEALEASVGVLSITAELANVTVGGGFYDHYAGPYVCDPAQTEQIFNTNNRIMDDDFKVLEVRYLETQTAGTTGKTVSILTE